MNIRPFFFLTPCLFFLNACSDHADEEKYASRPPVFEEIIFRFGIFRSFVNGNKKREIIGLIITTLLFALIHMVATVQEALSVTDGTGLSIFLNDLVTLPIYLIGAFCLTFAYYKSKNLATCVTMHMIYNFISYISIIAMSANIG